MIYKEEKRDLFSVPDTYYVVQCISADFEMDTETAMQFNNCFHTKEHLQHIYADFGGNYLPFWNAGNPRSTVIRDGRVINLVTKQRYFQKTNDDAMARALYDLRALCQKEGIHKLAIPKSGFVQDGMPWNEVSGITKRVFDKADVEILIL